MIALIFIVNQTSISVSVYILYVILAFLSFSFWTNNVKVRQKQTDNKKNISLKSC